MGEKGTQAIEKLPAGYHIDQIQGGGFAAHPDGLRPGLPLAWDPTHGAWTPPGFVHDGADADHIFNQTTGQNGVWDGDKQQWIDTQSGKPLTYEQ